MAQVHFENSMLRDPDSEKFLSEEDLSDYKQYRSSQRRQLIFKFVLFVTIIVLLVTTIVYFTKIHPQVRKENKLDACSNDQDKFTILPGKCFPNRIAMTDVAESFFDSLESCMNKCLSWPTCYSLDYFGTDGQCYTYSILSSEAPGEDVDVRAARHGVQRADDKRLTSCVHYDRACV